MDRCRIRRDHDIELQGAKTRLARLAQAMLGHSASNPGSLGVWCDHESGVGHMRAGTRLIRFQNVSADNPSVFFGHIRMRIVSEPISERLFARHSRIKRVRIAWRDNLLKNIPNGVMFGVRCRTYFHWSSKSSATSAAHGARGTQQARRASVLRAMVLL